MIENKSIGIIGDGSWATAVVKLLSNNNNNINWYIREQAMLDHMQKYSKNPTYLSSVKLDLNKISLYNDIKEVIKKSDILCFVIPSAFILRVLEGVDKNAFKDKLIVSLIKGIIPEKDLIISDYFKNIGFDLNNFAVVSGPCHAEEVALERLSYLTIGTNNTEFSEQISKLLSCRYIKTTLSDDIVGIEYAAILKNIMAVAAGICKSLGYGDNFQAVLIANALKEMTHFINTMHPIKRDTDLSVYLGDLAVTIYSQFSRNRTFGVMIGKGYSVNSAQLEMKMIAEGYFAVKGIKNIIDDKNITDMPITNAVYNILYENISPLIEINLLADKMS